MRTYNEKISIYHGKATTIAVNFPNNSFPIFGIIILGATNYQVGLISSLPPLMALFMTIPAILLNRAHFQKNLVAMSVLIARLMFLLIYYRSCVYTLSTNTSMAIPDLVALMNLPYTVANIGWQTFISGLVKESRRGEFFSDRNRLLTIVGLISTLSIGVVMKDASANVISYQILFGIAFCFSLLEVFLLLKHDEEPVKTEEILGKRKTMDWTIFNYKNYVAFLIATLVFNFAWQMTWGIFNIYHVRVLGATIFWISMFSVGSMLAQFISFPLWRKWAEKNRIR